jgi:hypothetical protein
MAGWPLEARALFWRRADQRCAERAFRYFSIAMPQATELAHVPPNYAIWQAYDPTVKADLFSTAALTQNGLIVVDPISLTADARLELEEMGSISAVLLTNANHVRAMTEFANTSLQFVPNELSSDSPQILTRGASMQGLAAKAISGAGPGEFAFHDPRDGGTLILGDALINLEPHGFTLLPAKYCANRRQMIRSLRSLLDLFFARIFFAHGYPILAGGRDRLAALLDAC